MGCQICIPTCGKCKPPLVKSFGCPICGKVLAVTRGMLASSQKMLCLGCGADISSAVRIEPKLCLNTGLTCAYPCGLCTISHAGGHRICLEHTALIGQSDTISPGGDVQDVLQTTDR